MRRRATDHPQLKKPVQACVSCIVICCSQPPIVWAFHSSRTPIKRRISSTSSWAVQVGIHITIQYSVLMQSPVRSSYMDPRVRRADHEAFWRDPFQIVNLLCSRPRRRNQGQPKRTTSNRGSVSSTFKEIRRQWLAWWERTFPSSEKLELIWAKTQQVKKDSEQIGDIDEGGRNKYPLVCKYANTLQIKLITDIHFTLLLHRER